MNEPTDSELVELCLGGDREAYARIVGRYQNLICALAYSACGNVARSEDIAQEVFLTAWKQLAQLRERARFKAWLCGIARNLIRNSLRRESHQPTAAAEPLDCVAEPSTDAPTPSEHAIRAEEQALVWTALAQIPEHYREPLVLFYRENQSVQQVAGALELSEDAVKQRLSRGRALLREQVAALVEGTLRQSRPGKAFTLGVLASLPALAPTLAAAAVAEVAGESLAVTKTVGALAGAGAILGPIIGILGGYLGVKASIENTHSARERRFMQRMAWMVAGFAVLFIIALTGVLLFARPLVARSPALFAGLLVGMVVIYAAGLVTLILCSNRRQWRIRTEEGAKTCPSDFMNTTPATAGASFAGHEYKSKAVLLGLPLVHVASGSGGFGPHHRRRVAKGWIAVGPIACGVLVAVGGISIGGIALGGIGVGVVAFAGLAAGVLAFGGLGAGVWAMGGVAVGVFAFGGAAIAWKAAAGGFALAHELALGGGAFAPHANDAVAQTYIEESAFFRTARASMKFARWAWLLGLLGLLPLWFMMMQRRGQPPGPASGAPKT